MPWELASGSGPRGQTLSAAFDGAILNFQMLSASFRKAHVLWDGSGCLAYSRRAE